MSQAAGWVGRLPFGSRPLAAAGIVCAAFAASGLLLAPSEPLWWLANFAGVASFILFGMAAVIVPGPGMHHPARRYVLHVRLSRWAVILMLVHAVAILVVDSSIWLYATTWIPLDVLLGILGLAAFLAAAAMREPWAGMASLEAARPMHRLLSVLGLGLAAGHVALIPGLGWPLAAAIGAGAVVVLLPLLKLRAWLPPKPVAAILALALAGASIYATVRLGEARMTQLRRAPADHRIFDHMSHVDVTCTTCHHNFLDRTGLQNCVSCHKAISTDEWSRIDRTFHAFCADCHAERKLAGKKAGPIQSCDACHDKPRASTSTSN